MAHSSSKKKAALLRPKYYYSLVDVLLFRCHQLRITVLGSNYKFYICSRAHAY